MQNKPDTPDERLQRRRVRRWKRRARILGPFLGVPLLLLTLSLSLDLIEYQAYEEPDRLVDRPIRMPQRTQRPVTRPSMRTDLSAAIATDSAISIETSDAEETDNDPADVDLTLPSPQSVRLPTPPHALRKR
jgi:hypothetical protein